MTKTTTTTTTIAETLELSRDEHCYTALERVQVDDGEWKYYLRTRSIMVGLLYAEIPLDADALVAMKQALSVWVL